MKKTKKKLLPQDFEATAGLDRLYRIFDVSPVAARVVHDGVSPIVVKEN